MTEITYCLAGVTPPNWMDLNAVDLDSGETLARVIEINTVEGWLVRQKVDPDGVVRGDPDTGVVNTERVTGRFAIVPKVAP